MGSVEAAETFYDVLAPLFDVMTDWEARLATEGPFLRHFLEQVGAVRVLDAACGSGGHALALARWGHQVVGLDASPAMIALARGKAAQAGLTVPFVVADLAMLADAVGAIPCGRPRGRVQDSGQVQDLPLQYDAVLCLGNSLPHLLSQADLVAALRGMAGALRPGGLFITQNLNYDLRWQTQPRFFAAQGGTHEGQKVLVWRFADYDVPAGRIAFHVALFRKGARGPKAVTLGWPSGQALWDVQVHTTPQRPLFQADLVTALTAAGLGEVQAYGRMALPLEPFDPTRSGDLVVVARKTSDPFESVIIGIGG
jgi:SAM-dependent methyltransferase